MTQLDRRILVLAPEGEESALIATALQDSGMEAQIVRGSEDLGVCVEQGAGAAVIERQALDTNTLAVLTRVVASQPPWSDFPIILLTDRASGPLIGKLASANVSVVERPLHAQTLIAAVRFALRARERQYQIREHLDELKRADGALSQSEERFRALVSASSEVLYRMSPDWTEMRHLGGGGFIADTNAPSKDWLQRYIHPDDQRDVWDVIQEAIRKKSLFQLEHRVLRADGSLGWTLSRAIAILDASGEITEWFGAASDVTERRRARERLEESESRFRLFMDNSPTIAWIKNEQGEYVYLSRTFEQRFRVRMEDWYGKTDMELWPEEEMARRFRENDLAMMASNRPIEVIEEAANPDGTKALWLNCKFPIVSGTTGQRFVAGIGLDVTGRKEAEQALIRSEKLAATGRLAATIAHEVNNPLSGALNAVYLATTDPTTSEQVREILALADQELRRAAHITQQTLGFYREDRSERPVALTKLIDEVLTVYARKLKERGVTVHCRYDCGSCQEGCEGCFLVNSGEMRQIISNLLANGMDALRDDGKLFIRLSRMTSPGGIGQSIYLTIADNGCGIRSENLKRIFEPFFTTKKSVGTGLGLWVTQELVRKHNGSIKVRSNDKGTVFRISIPAMPVTSGNSQEGDAATHPVPTGK